MNSKGVTPVIATVLLLTISIAATASAYTFITTVQEDVQSSFEDEMRMSELEAQSDLNIEYAYENSDGDLLVNIRNTGSIPLIFQNEDQINVLMFIDFSPLNGGEGWEFEDESLQQADLVEINPQETVTLNTGESFPDEGDDELWLEITGPYRTSSTHVCHPTDRPSC